MVNSKLLKIFAGSLFVIALFTTFNPAQAADPAAYSCIKSEVRDYYDRQGYKDPVVEVYCRYGNVGAVIKEWTHKGQRMKKDNHAAVPNNIKNMCGDPCK